MSSILYYSNFCDHSKKLVSNLAKSQNSKNIHFICIDNRVKGKDGKTYIQLQNGQKIIMPENVVRVPAVMLLNDNYRVIYGDEIYKYFRPQEAMQTKRATNNNMVPMSYQSQNDYDCFGGFGGGSIMSDNYSFLDQSDNDLGVKGNGGMRQMHNYVSLHGSSEGLFTPTDDYEYNKIKEGEMSIEALQRKRDDDMASLGIDNRQRI